MEGMVRYSRRGGRLSGRPDRVGSVIHPLISNKLFLPIFLPYRLGRAPRVWKHDDFDTAIFFLPEGLVEAWTVAEIRRAVADNGLAPTVSRR
jgi:hypothetical protein